MSSDLITNYNYNLLVNQLRIKVSTSCLTKRRRVVSGSVDELSQKMCRRFVQLTSCLVPGSGIRYKVVESMASNRIMKERKEQSHVSN